MLKHSRALVFGLVLVAGVLALATSARPEKVSAQTSCTLAPVNTQFRQSAVAETPWLNGAGFAPAQNSAIDVNCFAKNGAQLLTGGKISASVTYNGQTTVLTQSTWTNQLRDYVLTRPGVYTFTCATSGNACLNSDSFTVTGTAPTNPVTPPATPAGTCDSISIDGNKTPSVGQTIQFRCNGPAGANPVFFSYRTSPTASLQQLQTQSGNLSTPVEITPFFQAQCNPCVGTVCATSEVVNTHCTFTQDTTVVVPPTPAATPTTSIADLNKDGKVDINDYRLFLQEYLKFVK